MKTEHIIVIEPNGTLRHIYDDALIGLDAEGVAVTQRASHVEPLSIGGWCADMAPSGGTILGPFPTRGAALEAEVAWLKERMTT